jgi:hypothetical protein
VLPMIVEQTTNRWPKADTESKLQSICMYGLCTLSAICDQPKILMTVKQSRVYKKSVVSTPKPLISKATHLSSHMVTQNIRQDKLPSLVANTVLNVATLIIMKMSYVRPSQLNVLHVMENAILRGFA